MAPKGVSADRGMIIGSGSEPAVVVSSQRLECSHIGRVEVDSTDSKNSHIL